MNASGKPENPSELDQCRVADDMVTQGSKSSAAMVLNTYDKRLSVFWKTTVPSVSKMIDTLFF